ncbi:hypothetical protein Tco_0672195 [Tanacetum coccineum]
MTTTTAQQVALDNALVPLEKRVEIGMCNMKIDPAKTQKEPTYQVVLDVVALTTCYTVFLITADVPEIYMHQFWFTINKKDSTSYRICPRLPTQKFDALPSDEDIVSFTKELGHKGDLKSITEVVVEHMYQPWRTFIAIINKCLSGKITDSDAYKTYLAYATGATSPKMKRKVKRSASLSKKRTLIIIEEEEHAPAKKDKPKKAPTKVARSKENDLLSEAALLEEAQFKKALKISKPETSIHKAGGSSEGANFELEVPDEPKGKSIDTSEGTGLKLGVLDMSKESDDEPIETDNPKTSDDEEEIEDDEFVHTPEDYVPTDDETNDESNDVTEEEYERINKELYGDVNVSLIDAEHAGNEKDYEEMTVFGHVNINQEGVGNQVKDDAQAT